MKSAITFLILGSVFSLFAQSDVFETDGKGNREIEKRSRILSYPKIVDTIKQSPISTRPLMDLKASVKVTTDTIQAAEIETEQLLNKFYPAYLKLGMGSALNPLGELYINSTRSRNNYFGLHIKHNSFFGDIKNREKQLLAPATFDKTSFLGTFQSTQSKYTFLSQINYLNHGFHYYVLVNPSANKDSIAQRYQSFDATLGLDLHRGDTAVFNVRTTAKFRFTGTAKPYIDSLADWKSRERGFSLNSMGYYRTAQHEFFGLLGLRYNGYSYGILDSMLAPSDSGLISKNTIFDINPGIKSIFNSKKLSINAGFLVSIDNGPATKAYFFPAVSLQYALIKNVLVPYLSLKGQVKQNNLFALYNSNPFILTNLILQNEVNPYDIQLGIRGKIGSSFNAGLGANFIKINTRAFFITDTLLSTGNRFNLVYDSLNQTTLEAFMSFNYRKKMLVSFLARYHSYEMLHEAKAWNLPQMEFQLSASYNLYNKLLFKVDFYAALNRFAQVYANGTGVQTLNNQYFINLGPIIDGNLSMEYRYNNRFSGFLQVNNVAAQRYLQFYNYPVIPIQVLAGITCKF